jgi:hypothetical protein
LRLPISAKTRGEDYRAETEARTFAKARHSRVTLRLRNCDWGYRLRGTTEIHSARYILAQWIGSDACHACGARSSAPSIRLATERRRLCAASRARYKSSGGTARLFQVSDRDMYARLGLLREEYGNIAA